MVKHRSDRFGDRSLGLGRRICRREFLNGTLLAAGGALLGPLTPAQLLAQKSEWDGYTGEGDYRNSNGNTEEVVRVAHAIRDGAFDKVPANTIDTGGRTPDLGDEVMRPPSFDLSGVPRNPQSGH